MATNARRLAILCVLTLLVSLVMLSLPEATPAQPAPTDTATEIPTSTTVPATETPAPPTTTPTDIPTITPAATVTPLVTVEPTETLVQPTENATEPLSPTSETATVTSTITPAGTPAVISAANHTATIAPTQTTVNGLVTYTLANFPANATVQIFWTRNTGSIFQFATTSTDATGAVIGTFRVPAVTGGPEQIIAFVSGKVAKRVRIEIRPRIKLLTNLGFCGQQGNISLRGYGKREQVRIRWKNGAGWTQLATVETSNTGSANVLVTIPAFAVDGFNSVRGDGTVFRQQTNRAFVHCS